MSNPISRRAALAALVIAAVHVHAVSAQTISLIPDSLAFFAMVGGPNPPPQGMAVANTGGGALRWRIVPASLAPWLSPAPLTGGAPDSVSFSVSIAGMGPGVYVDSVQVASNDKALVYPTPSVEAPQDLSE